jgi:hypothetical protein
MLNVIYAEVANKLLMLSVIMLNVIILSVVAPSTPNSIKVRTFYDFPAEASAIENGLE